MNNESLIALPVNKMLDIIPGKAIFKQENLPNYCVGTINWETKTLPVIEGNKHLKPTLSPIKESDSCVLVIEVSLNDEKTNIGILVNSTNDILRIKNEMHYVPHNFIKVNRQISSGYIGHNKNENMSLYFG